VLLLLRHVYQITQRRLIREKPERCQQSDTSLVPSLEREKPAKWSATVAFAPFVYNTILIANGVGI